MYERFKYSIIDTSPVGLERTDYERRYFCTPVGAEIIGWEAEGIHYCRLPAYGDMVFAVNPMTCCDKYVYPLSRTFTDFLRLILAAKGVTALEQIILWDKEQYLAYVQAEGTESRPEVDAVLRELQDTFGLQPMEDPFAYVKDVQNGFDDSKIEFSDEYYECTGFSRP